jgi:hypothetical protein
VNARTSPFVALVTEARVVLALKSEEAGTLEVSSRTRPGRAWTSR